MRDTQTASVGRGQLTQKNRLNDRWQTIELTVVITMLTLSFGTLITLLHWPLALSGMDYLLLIITYVSLTGAQFTAKIIRWGIHRKEKT